MQLVLSFNTPPAYEEVNPTKGLHSIKIPHDPLKLSSSVNDKANFCDAISLKELEGDTLKFVFLDGELNFTV